jgi:hypothetical protein
MDVKFVQYGVCVLQERLVAVGKVIEYPLTLLRLAVNTTTSYISPIFFKKLSTPGRLITYTLCQ